MYRLTVSLLQYFQKIVTSTLPQGLPWLLDMLPKHGFSFSSILQKVFKVEEEDQSPMQL
jgi:hypothetical protein